MNDQIQSRLYTIEPLLEYRIGIGPTASDVIWLFEQLTASLAREEMLTKEFQEDFNEVKNDYLKSEEENDQLQSQLKIAMTALEKITGTYVDTNGNIRITPMLPGHLAILAQDALKELKES